MLSEDMKWYESSGQGPVVRSPENKGIEGSFTLSSMSLQEINGKIYYLEGDGYPHYPEVVELLYDFTLQEGDFVAVLKSWECRESGCGRVRGGEAQASFFGRKG